MSDTNQAADVGGSEPISIVTIEPTERGTSTLELARMLGEQRRKRDEQAPPDTGEPPAAKPPPAQAAPADATPPQEAPGEEAIEEPGPDEASPIPLPRSWTREQSEHWNTLPRETQAYIAQREQERDRAIRQSQNEAAEKLRGLTAKEQLVEQARQYYEQTLPVLQENLQNHIAGEFSDIRTMADARALAQLDPQRYSRWDAAQKELALVTEQANQTRHKAQQEQQQAWDRWSAEQDRLFNEKAPEIADPVKGPVARKAAQDTLTAVGFNQDELVDSWNRGLLRDHRVQLLVWKAARFDQAEAASKKAAAKPVPQVQRPGVSRPRGAADSEAVDALTQQLDKRGDAKTAAALLIARRNARS
jgi:hypothetical protein